MNSVPISLKCGRYLVCVASSPELGAVKGVFALWFVLLVDVWKANVGVLVCGGGMGIVVGSVPTPIRCAVVWF